MEERRIGKFSISPYYLREGSDEAAEVFVQMRLVVFRCEYLVHKDQIEYIGLSRLFRSVSTAIEPPEYELVIRRDSETEEITVQAVELV